MEDGRAHRMVVRQNHVLLPRVASLARLLAMFRGMVQLHWKQNASCSLSGLPLAKDMFHGLTSGGCLVSFCGEELSS